MWHVREEGRSKNSGSSPATSACHHHLSSPLETQTMPGGAGIAVPAIPQNGGHLGRWGSGGGSSHSCSFSSLSSPLLSHLSSSLNVSVSSLTLFISKNVCSSHLISSLTYIIYIKQWLSHALCLSGEGREKPVPGRPGMPAVWLHKPSLLFYVNLW